jgi:hypothetical protein
MKKLFIIFLMLVVSQLFVQAQTVEITPFGGYVFPARWNAANGSLYFDGNAMYGGSISLGVSRVMDVDFTYTRIDTKVTAESYGYGAFNEVGVSENFYMLGFTKNFRVNETVSPFIGFNLGGVYMSPKESGYYDYWFFALGLDGGVKVYFSKHVGFMAPMQLNMPVQYGGFTFYYGGTGVYVNSTLLDFGFTGGLVFRLGRVQ